MDLLEIAFDQHGYVSTADARKAGIDIRRLADMVESGGAVRVNQGLYRLSMVPVDEFDSYMCAAKWPRDEGVISHVSAVKLFEIADVNPTRIDVTVPARFRTTRSWPSWLRIHKQQLSTADVTRIEGVPVVNAFVAIRQMIDSGERSDLARQAAENAREAALVSDDQFYELRVSLNRWIHGV